MTDIEQADARPGDLAWHKDGLDPRRVTYIDEQVVFIDIMGSQVGPLPIENYTYTRPGS